MLHLTSTVLFAGSSLKLDTIENVVLPYSLFYDNHYGALLCCYIATGAYEYIEYNY